MFRKTIVYNAPPITDVENPTDLNKCIDGTLCWGHYRHVVEPYDLTFTPALRLKLYIELLHQTNINADSLGHVLRATNELAKMFIAEPREAFITRASDNKESIINGLPLESMPHLYNVFAYPSLKGIHSQTLTQEQTLRSLETIDTELSSTFSLMESEIEKSFESTKKTIDRILTSFGSDGLYLFQDVFLQIATHPKTKPSDRKKAIELLVQAGEPSDLLTYAQIGIATDHTRCINDRLNAAKILSKTPNTTNTAIVLYKQIIETVTSVSNLEDESKKFSYLLEAGLGLHRAGALDQGIEILAAQLGWLLPKIDSMQFIMDNASNVISAAEILFNSGKLTDRSTVIKVIDWAVKNDYSEFFFTEATLIGAETAERLGDRAAATGFFKMLRPSQKNDPKFQDRVSALEAKLSAATTAAVDSTTTS